MSLRERAHLHDARVVHDRRVVQEVREGLVHDEPVVAARKTVTAPVGSAGRVNTVVRPAPRASTGTGRAPTTSTSAGRLCQPGQTMRTSSVAVARSAARISSPAP